MKENELFEKIELFLQGKLDDNEHKLFKKQIETDNELARKVETYKSAIKGIEISERAELKKTLQNIHREYIDSRKQRNYNTVLKIAAVFIGFVLLSSPFIYKYITGGTSTEKLFAENFSPYPDLISQRSETTSNVMLLEAMSYYKNGEYENASVLFNELLSHGYETDTLLMFYNGISILGADHPDSAITQFNKLIDAKNSFSESAKWYKALALIESERIDEAEKLLTTIVQSKSYNFTKAEKLIKKIEKLKDK
jgi:hypothetical protein